jgi:hypothetical protein
MLEAHELVVKDGVPRFDDDVVLTHGASIHQRSRLRNTPAAPNHFSNKWYVTALDLE